MPIHIDIELIEAPGLYTQLTPAALHLKPCPRLGRKDLGRLAVGAKADLVVINLRTTRYGPARDPINALVEYGSGADVEAVMVDGELVVENGRSTRIDEEELFAQAEAGTKRAWDNWPERDWSGRNVEQIIPPAFPTRQS
jgi:adenine deaminase